MKEIMTRDCGTRSRLGGSCGKTPSRDYLWIVVRLRSCAPRYLDRFQDGEQGILGRFRRHGLVSLPVYRLWLSPGLVAMAQEHKRTGIPVAAGSGARAPA